MIGRYKNACSRTHHPYSRIIPGLESSVVGLTIAIRAISTWCIMSAEKEPLETLVGFDKEAIPEYCGISSDHISSGINDVQKSITSYTRNRQCAPQEEKSLVRKIDMQLMLLLALSYGLQYYDKPLLGQTVGFPRWRC